MPIEVSRSLAEMQSEMSTSPPAVVAPSALTPDEPISATVPDWTREDPDPQWRREPGKALIRSIRRYQKWKARKGPFARLMQKYYAMKWRFWRAVPSSGNDLTTPIQRGFVLPPPPVTRIHTD